MFENYAFLHYARVSYALVGLLLAQLLGRSPCERYTVAYEDNFFQSFSGTELTAGQNVHSEAQHVLSSLKSSMLNKFFPPCGDNLHKSEKQLRNTKSTCKN